MSLVWACLLTLLLCLPTRSLQLNQARSLVLLVVKPSSSLIFSPNLARSTGRFYLSVQPMNMALLMREFPLLQETLICSTQPQWRKSFLSATTLRVSALLSTKHFWRETRIGLIRMRLFAPLKIFLVRGCGRSGLKSIVAGHKSYSHVLSLFMQLSFIGSTNLLLMSFGVRL